MQRMCVSWSLYAIKKLDVAIRNSYTFSRAQSTHSYDGCGLCSRIFKLYAFLASSYLTDATLGRAYFQG